MPKFICLLPVRDEADIVDQCVEHLLTWADAIYVFDTGSVDNTWEIIEDLALRDKRVVTLKKDPVYFSETLVRGWLFNQARQQMRNGDWFLRVDADEFHHISPRDFVRTRMRKHETIAYHQYYDFRFTESELKKWEAGEETLSDRNRPIEERRRWFTPSVYSEPRLCRYRETMQWPQNVSFPHNAGFTARERLPIRHYPYRDPDQLRNRCLVRAYMIALNSSQMFTGYQSADVERLSNLVLQMNHAEIEAEWHKFVVPDDLSNLQFWKQGSPLPAFSFQSHLPSFSTRLMQRLLHLLLLPLIDRKRLRWQKDSYPDKIPAEIVQRMENELKFR